MVIYKRGQLNKYILIAAFLVLIIAVAVIATNYILRPYEAEGEYLQLAQNNPAVDVVEQDNYFLVRPEDAEPEEESEERPDSAQYGVIYYPGGLVTPESYLDTNVSLVEQALANGVDLQVFIPKPPLNLIVFNSRAATDIVAENAQIDEWYIGGHSLGGAMACRYLAEEIETAESAESAAKEFQGLFLFASYCDRDISQFAGRVMQLNGSRDLIINRDAAANSASFHPENSLEVQVEGMNHSQFAHYGEQRGDGRSQITDDEASLIWIGKFLNFLLDLENNGAIE